MGEPDITAVFGALAHEMAGMSSALANQGVAQMVPLFYGEIKHFRSWLKAVEKYIKLHKIDNDNNKILIALQASAGPVSGYIGEYIEATPDAKFDNLKIALRKRFSDVTDRSQALAMLRNIKQKHGEGIQVYAEWLLSLAKDAFDKGGPEIERQLIDIFVDGLADERLKLKVLRNISDNLQNAITIVTDEQNLRKRVGMTTYSPFSTASRHEPMEVDHARKLRCFNCSGSGHIAKYCKADTRKQVNATAQSSRAPRYEGQNKANIRCYRCSQFGHMARECTNQDPWQQPRMPRVGSQNNRSRNETSQPHLN